MKKICALILIMCLSLSSICAIADELDVTARSYILRDADSGKIILDKSADNKMPPASITKIMTMLLTMEALDNGKIKKDDIVTVSKYAATKTGSHVFLSEGERITVDELLKSVAVASGNDAAMALGEYISGSQSEFVKLMNNRAKELGMTNTNFINCHGLDEDGHYSSARDISVMTSELLKHPNIFNYTTIWMDTIRNGEFGLSNTNKLIRFYEGANGMKTGSTTKAGSCLSATAKRGDMQLIAVVLNSSTSDNRFLDASALLDYGFNNFESVTLCSKEEAVKYIGVTGGESEIIKTVCEDTVKCIVRKSTKEDIKISQEIPAKVKAPIKKGDVLGYITYSTPDGETYSVNVIADEDVKKATFSFYLKSILEFFINIF